MSANLDGPCSAVGRPADAGARKHRADFALALRLLSSTGCASDDSPPTQEHSDQSNTADEDPSESGAPGEQNECACGGCDEDPDDVAKEVCESSFAYVEQAAGCDGYVVYRYLDADRTFTRFISDTGELLAHSSRACQAGTEPPTGCASEVCTVCLGPGAEGAHASKLTAMCDE